MDTPFDDQDTGLGIAVIGFAGRFPGADDVETFWQNLCAGVESTRFFSDEEMRVAGVPEEILAQPNFAKAAPRLEYPDYFDAAFFDYPQQEADWIDPQQRLFLEVAWEALEHAGYAPGSSALARTHPVGVYAGEMQNTYLLNCILGAPASPATSLQGLLGNSPFGITARVAYKMDLTGPVMTVQAACATGLFAVHHACRALLFDECRIALAGASAIDLNGHWGYYHDYDWYFSPDGHCRPFDAQAKGMVFGSGVGALVLKRIEDAVDDGDTIYAVIQGSAIGNDGAEKSSFDAPGIVEKTRVIMDGVACAGVEFDAISYVETQGIGTPLLDSMEILAMTKAFRAGTARKGFCKLGSVEGNIGHADAASSVIKLIKVIQALYHRQIPPTLNFEAPNPAVDLANSPFVVNATLMPWEDVPLPRRAGINAFGAGGYNAHMVLEEAPPAAPGSASRPAQLLVLSAKTASALETQTRQLADYLRRHPDLSLADVAFTLQMGRHAFLHRRMIVAQTVDEAVQQLASPPFPAHQTATVAVLKPGVVWMFPGEGAQYAGMGRDLYHGEPVFRAAVDRCAELLKPHLDGVDLRAVLYPEPGQAAFAAAQLAQPRFAQPALFVIEYALAQLWLQWGLRPQALIGHGLGEYAAACLAGVFDLPDALVLVAARGRLAQAQSVKATELLLAPAAGVARHAPQISLISGVTGTRITDEQATSPDYWATPLQPAVHFLEGVRQLQSESLGIFLEVGPGDTLCALIKQQATDPAPALAVASMRCPQQVQSDGVALLNAAGQLWLNDVVISWEALYAQERRLHVALPTYPFERQRCWVGAPPGILPLRMFVGASSKPAGMSAETSTEALPEAPAVAAGFSKPSAGESPAAPASVSDMGLARLWVSRPNPNPAAKRRLFCFPYAGGGAAVFYRWPEYLPADVEVCAIRAPGRESRSQEPPLTDFVRFIQTLTAAIRPLLDRPFAFFGHSLGALIAFEVARQLRREGAPLPERLLVSAYRAPQLPGRYALIHDLSADEFLQGVLKYGGIPSAVMENAELLEAMLPALRADFALAETYVYTAEPPLSCPLSVFNGSEDAHITREELAAWNAQTQATVAFHSFPGGHFYLNDARQDLLAAIGRDWK